MLNGSTLKRLIESLQLVDRRSELDHQRGNTVVVDPKVKGPTGDEVRYIVTARVACPVRPNAVRSRR